MTKLVSILTPSLDQAAYVRDSISSIRNQDYRAIEQVVVDGGSTDGTLDVVRRYEGDGCRLVVAPGTSQAQALNIALAHSAGDIIGWLNTDDAYFGVDAVAAAVRTFEECPEAVAVYGDGVIADEAGRILRRVSTSAADLGRLQSFSPLVQPSVFVRREALGERFVREDLEVMIDYELWLYLARRGPFAKVGRILAIDRDYSGRKTRETLPAQARDLAKLSGTYALDPQRPAGRIGRAWFRRANGLTELLTLETRYTFAFAGQTDARWRRFARQLLLPQRLLRVV